MATTETTISSGGSAVSPSSETVDYVVQVQQEEGAGPDDRHMAWVDVATVSVPPKTKRKTALRQGLAEAGIELTPELEARVLDAENGYVWKALPPEPKALRLA